MLLADRSEADVARTFRVSREAVRKWKNGYLADRLEPVEVGRPPRVAPERIADIVDRVMRSPRRFGLTELWTVADLALLLQRKIGVHYAIQSVHAMLRRLGYRFELPGGWRRSPVVVPRRPAPWGYAYDAAGKLVREAREHGITCIVRHMRLISRMSVAEIRDDLTRAGARDRDGRAFTVRHVSRMLNLSREPAKARRGTKSAGATARRPKRGAPARRR